MTKRNLDSSTSDADSHEDSDNEFVIPKDEPSTTDAASDSESDEIETKSPKKRKIKIIKIESCSPQISLSKQKKKYGVVNKHLDNIRTILLNSNATPVKCKQGIWYNCCFCTNKYAELTDLKLHTIDSHDDKTKSDFMTDRSLGSFYVKLDVTDLQCNCGLHLDKLDDLTDHLVKEHGKTFHKDIDSQILPFRFENGLLKCVICETVYNSFKLIIEHMNMHFPNYICGECGHGFVNRDRLKVHSGRHKNEGEFSCSYCEKVYPSKVRQKEHERQVHITQNKRNKCGLCGEKFADYTHKYKHEEEVHGVKKTLLQCQACDRAFSNQRALTAHKKVFHLMQYPKKKSANNPKDKCDQSD